MQLPVSTDCTPTLRPGAASTGAEEAGFGEQFQDAQETLASQQALAEPTTEGANPGSVPPDFLSAVSRLDIFKTLIPVSTGSIAAMSPGAFASVTAVEPALVDPLQDAAKAAKKGTSMGVRLAPLQTGWGKSSPARTAASNNVPGNKEEKEGDASIAVIVCTPASDLRVDPGKLRFPVAAICARPAPSESSSNLEEVPAGDVQQANNAKRKLAGDRMDKTGAPAPACELPEIQMAAGTTPIQLSGDTSSTIQEKQADMEGTEGLRASPAASMPDAGTARTHRVMDAPVDVEGIRGKGTTPVEKGITRADVSQSRFIPLRQTGVPQEKRQPVETYMRAAISAEPAELQGIPAHLMHAAEAYTASGSPAKSPFRDASSAKDASPAKVVQRTNVSAQITSDAPRDKADLAITVSARPKDKSDSVETMPRKPFGQLMSDKDERPAIVQETETGQVHASAVRPTTWSFAGPQVGREAPSPVAELKQQPIDALPEPDRVAAREVKPLNSSAPVRNISLHVGQVGQPKVEVQVTERSGEVHVAVRSGDSEMVRGLRHDLPELVNRLEDSGFSATAWRPSGVIGGTSQASESQQGGSEYRGQQPDSQSGGSHSSHDQRGHRNSNPQQWAEEFEDINQAIDRTTGEIHGLRH